MKSVLENFSYSKTENKHPSNKIGEHFNDIGINSPDKHFQHRQIIE